MAPDVISVQRRHLGVREGRAVGARAGAAGGDADAGVVTPDVISFSAAISACEKGGQWERALALLEEMRERAWSRNVISFNAAISACEKGGRWERALSLLDEMREAGVEPDVISFSAAISACEKGGQWERALALLDEMRRAAWSRT